jgi:hypothetical protein
LPIGLRGHAAEHDVLPFVIADLGKHHLERANLITTNSLGTAVGVCPVRTPPFSPPWGQWIRPPAWTCDAAAGSVYALVAVDMTIIFGVLRAINAIWSRRRQYVAWVLPADPQVPSRPTCHSG